MDKVIHWTYCPICRQQDVTFADGIGECHVCKHKFREYVPADILPHYYDKQYWDKDKNRQGITSVSFSSEWKRWVAARMKILESFHLVEQKSLLMKVLEMFHLIGQRSSPPPEILEFGCAEGMLLYALKKKGYAVTGNDVCAVADESMKTLGIEISKKPVEEFAAEGRKFDLIMSFHTVEHLRNPVEVLGHLNSMLKPGGKLLMHLPVDDQELGNVDHFHFFSNESCMRLMSYYTEDIQSDFVYYPITKGGAALAATYVGTKP